jgi:hypothetical protein
VIRALLVIFFWGCIVIAGLAYLPWPLGASAVIAGLAYAIYRIKRDGSRPEPPSEGQEWQPRPRTRDPGSE